MKRKKRYVFKYDGLIFSRKERKVSKYSRFVFNCQSMHETEHSAFILVSPYSIYQLPRSLWITMDNNGASSSVPLNVGMHSVLLSHFGVYFFLVGRLGDTAFPSESLPNLK